MESHSHAYNSVWQMRADAWYRLEDAAGQLARLAASGKPTEARHATCADVLAQLVPVEPYWAFPGPALFAKLQKIFRSGDYTKFAIAVGYINHALTHETYRLADAHLVDLDNEDILAADAGRVEGLSAADREPKYFEVLAIETLTEAQERYLRQQVHNWRRPDDEFIYELVIVSNAEEALVAARLNANLQAAVIGRQFTAHSGRDLSSLADFIDSDIADAVGEETDSGQRAEILAHALRELWPGLDRYLMTEVDVERIAGLQGNSFRRVFHVRDGLLELHLSLMQGIADRYRTPFFSALKEYSKRPTGVFHALPISQGKSIIGSHWIKDMVDFYGLDIFMAETSATCGGLDSLLEPTGPLREAQELAAETFGSRQTFFVTNGTSTANKIITQSLVAPGDIVLLDRNCHQSHHYGMMLGGANVVYLEAYALNDYTIYGAVTLREIKSKLLDLRRAGKLDRVKMIALTNCTFDGIVYDVQRVMEECLAIKPDLVFLWDEAWFAFARFHPVLRTRTAMHSARKLRDLMQDPDYAAAYEEQLARDAENPPTDEELLDRRLRPDPAKARVRVYAAQSTHKTLTSLRQGSMIHVFDQDFDQKVAEPFHEAYMAHTSTSPNYQILASLDLGRRQVALEGMEMVSRQIENAMQLRDAIDNHPLLAKYMACLRTSDLIPEDFRASHIGQPLRTGLRAMMRAWDSDEFVLDPSRITLSIGRTGYSGDDFKRDQLMDRHGVQINKTSRNTVLFMTNIGTTRSSVAFLVEVLVTIASELDEHLSEMSLSERSRFEKRVQRLTSSTAPLPDFSGFHSAFRDHSGSVETPEGDVRRAFYLSYDDANCEYLLGEEIEEKINAGKQVVSATFVTPYPPGFPVLVPGQVVSQQILTFIRDLDTKEIHGYSPEIGYRVYTDKAIEMASAG